MKVLGLDGREHIWNVNANSQYSKRSDGHIRCRALLKKMFPFDSIAEELTLPGTKNLKSDFYLHTHKMIIEVQGEQHYKFVKLFHQDIAGFKASKKRDQNKRDWCELNNIKLVELPHDESDEEWTERIISGI